MSYISCKRNIYQPQHTQVSIYFLEPQWHMEIATQCNGGTRNYLLHGQQILPVSTKQLLSVLSTDLRSASKETNTDQQRRLFTENQKQMVGYQVRKNEKKTLTTEDINKFLLTK